MFVRRSLPTIILVGVTFAAILFVRPVAAAIPNAAPDQYIVVFKDGVADPAGKAHRLAAAHGLTLLHTYLHALKGFAAVIPTAHLAQIQADPSVAYITPDQVVSITDQTLPTGIDRIDGELSSTVSGNGSGTVNVDVAVIDTGIDRSHPDLDVVGGINCVPGNSGFEDQYGHGTHVAGTIGALDNGIGVVGVAPGARLWAVRVLGASGSGSTSSVVCGIDWVTANAATIEVANMSLGGSGSDDGNCGRTVPDAMHQAICNSVAAGVTYAVSAGNSADDAANQVPAAYDEVITVSALADFDGKPGGLGAPTCRADEDDTLANFSNFGADIDLIAPGVCILSTVPINGLVGSTTGYRRLSGTSMSSPHVAGAAALYKSAHPSAKPSQIKNALQHAGNLNWNNGDDPDGIKEVLLNVDSL
jgi:subtilisin family serine protease